MPVTGSSNGLYFTSALPFDANATPPDTYFNLLSETGDLPITDFYAVVRKDKQDYIFSNFHKSASTARYLSECKELNLIIICSEALLDSNLRLKQGNIKLYFSTSSQSSIIVQGVKFIKGQAPDTPTVIPEIDDETD